MRSEDLPAVGRLCRELGYPVTEEELAARFEPLTGSGADALFVVETSDSAVGGWIHVGSDLALTHAPGAEIRGLVVAGERRGTGLGRRLVAAAEAWSASRGCRTIRVRTRVAREEALRFYERCGYSRSKTQHVLSRELDRA